MKFLCANRIAPDGTPRSAASHLGLFCLFCLHFFHKKDARLKLVLKAMQRVVLSTSYIPISEAIAKNLFQ